jgi:hypothetical protein
MGTHCDNLTAFVVRPMPGRNWCLLRFHLAWDADDPGLREEVGVMGGGPRRAAMHQRGTVPQREEDGALLARVRSSSRIAGLLVRARAWSMARRVRAACRRCCQLDVPLIIVVPFIEVQ